MYRMKTKVLYVTVHGFVTEM